MEYIDSEVLITLVEARPVLWDKFLDIYKDRNATKDAWHEVCVELLPEFDVLHVKDKNVFGKEVLKRWTNLRDSFSKYKKKIKANKASGSKAIKSKKYVYFDKLQFLSKVYDEQETVDSIEKSEETVNEEREESMELQLQVPTDVLDVSTPVIAKSTSSTVSKGRKHKKADNVELRNLKAIEGEKPCSKMAFLQSLMLHLQKFDDEEFLQFQMGVLTVIGNINETKKTMHPHPSHQQFSTYPQQHVVHPSTTTQSQPQQFVNIPPNQPPFYRQQLLNMGGQASSTYAQTPVPNQTPQIQKLSPRSSGESEQPSPSSPYFKVFASPESDENSISVVSSIADSVDFGTIN